MTQSAGEKCRDYGQKTVGSWERFLNSASKATLGFNTEPLTKTMGYMAASFLYRMVKAVHRSILQS